RAGKMWAQQGAPFGEGRGFAEAHHMVFQRVPYRQQDEAIGILDAAMHLGLAASLGGADQWRGLGESFFEILGLAGFDGEERASQDHRPLRILAAMGSSRAASTMTLPWGASATPSQRGTMWKWTWKTLWPAAARLYCLSRMPSGSSALSTALATFCTVA